MQVHAAVVEPSADAARRVVACGDERAGGRGARDRLRGRSRRCVTCCGASGTTHTRAIEAETSRGHALRGSIAHAVPGFNEVAALHSRCEGSAMCP